MIGIFKAIAAFFGFAEKAVELVHDHNVEVAGENKIVAADLKEENVTNAKALDAIIAVSGKPVADSLRDGSF